MTPPNASDPYATEPGPRATSIVRIDRRIEKRRVRPRAPLGGRAAAIDQDQRPPSRQPSHRRHRGLSLGDRAHARHDVERLAQRPRMTQLEIRARE